MMLGDFPSSLAIVFIVVITFKNGDGGILLIMRRGWVGDGGNFVRA